jgi:hypothetical protein
MRRRNLIVFLGAMFATSPLAVRAQTSGKVARDREAARHHLPAVAAAARGRSDPVAVQTTRKLGETRGSR